MKADDANTVLAEHHQLLRTLTDQIDAATTGTTQHRGLIDRLLLELDIHMQIEDTLYYPAVSKVSPLVAIAHAEHRAVSDQLATALRTDMSSAEFPIEWTPSPPPCTTTPPKKNATCSRTPATLATPNSPRSAPP